jgi:hypothetical protein
VVTVKTRFPLGALNEAVQTYEPGASRLGEQCGDDGVRLTTTALPPSVRIFRDWVLGATYLGVIRAAFFFGAIASERHAAVSRLRGLRVQKAGARQRQRARRADPCTAAAAAGEQRGAESESKDVMDPLYGKTHTDNVLSDHPSCAKRKCNARITEARSFRLTYDDAAVSVSTSTKIGPDERSRII